MAKAFGRGGRVRSVIAGGPQPRRASDHATDRHRRALDGQEVACAPTFVEVKTIDRLPDHVEVRDQIANALNEAPGYEQGLHVQGQRGPVPFEWIAIEQNADDCGDRKQ